MSATDTARITAPDAERLLDDLKRIAVEQLGVIPGSFYQAIEAQLQDKLQRGAADAQHADLVAVLALRQRGASLVMRFRELIARNFDALHGRPGRAMAGTPLGLVAEEELGFHLAGQRLAESIGRRYERPLELLNLRFEALADLLGSQTRTNPVGATRLAGAFLRTFQDAELSENLQPLLFRQYEQELSNVLGDLYARLNRQLSEHGFHADLGRAAGERSTPPPPARPAPPPEAAGQRHAVSGADIDLFRVSAEQRVRHQRLRDLLHSWRNGGPSALSDAAQVDPAEASTPRANDGRRELRVQELTSVAALLQRDSAKAFERALSGSGELNAAIRAQLFEGARSLGVDTDHSCLGEHEEDAIDMVGMMFESLLGTHALVGHARKLYARLVMSYVRIALTDENLFVRPDHPARRLLDALTLSCESNEGASPQDRELLHRASEAVARVVAEFNEDLAVFDLASNELQDLLEQQRRRAEVVERRSVDTVHGRERLLQARLQAAAALVQRTSDRALTPVTAQFLEEHWQHHLLQALLRGGPETPQCGKVLALADELVGIDEAAARGEGRDIAARVLALREGLVECLSSSGLDAQVAEDWMAGLARALAFPDSPREVRRQRPVQQLPDDSDDTRLLRLVGGHAALDFDPAIAQRIAALVPGSWMRLVDESGEEGSVKVAWISPLTSRLLLVNRRGLRKLVASPQQLAALVKGGTLLVEAADLPFDEAMRHVRLRLTRLAETA